MTNRHKYVAWCITQAQETLARIQADQVAPDRINGTIAVARAYLTDADAVLQMPPGPLIVMTQGGDLVPLEEGKTLAELAATINPNKED